MQHDLQYQLDMVVAVLPVLPFSLHIQEEMLQTITVQKDVATLKGNNTV